MYLVAGKVSMSINEYRSQQIAYLTTHIVNLDNYRWIQNMAVLQRNSHIRRVFEFDKPRCHRDKEHNFRVRAIFPIHDWKHILNPIMLIFGI